MQLAYMHLLEELKPKLAPPGLDLSDGQAVDIAVATLHEMLVLDKLAVVNMDTVMEVLNRHFKTAFSRFFVEAMTKAGHAEVKTAWTAAGGVIVTWDGGRMEISAQVFTGAFGNKDTWLRDMRTGARPS